MQGDGHMGGKGEFFILYVPRLEDPQDTAGRYNTDKRPVCVYCIVDQMHAKGGTFVKLLAELWWHADPQNKGKIVTTWRNYFEEYGQMIVDTGKPCPDHQ